MLDIPCTAFDGGWPVRLGKSSLQMSPVPLPEPRISADVVRKPGRPSMFSHLSCQLAWTGRSLIVGLGLLSLIFCRLLCCISAGRSIAGVPLCTGRHHGRCPHLQEPSVNLKWAGRTQSCQVETASSGARTCADSSTTELEGRGPGRPRFGRLAPQPAAGGGPDLCPHLVGCVYVAFVLGVYSQMIVGRRVATTCGVAIAQRDHCPRRTSTPGPPRSIECTLDWLMRYRRLAVTTKPIPQPITSDDSTSHYT
jgi:hypothetical protein